jgi:peptidoglycan/xylan/chitin deacetylase (PgdA/CDA1 family)
MASVVRREVEEGHSVSSHSWSHPNFLNLTLLAAQREVEKTYDVRRAALVARHVAAIAHMPW